jgi:hypothetical protein
MKIGKELKNLTVYNLEDKVNQYIINYSDYDGNVYKIFQSYDSMIIMWKNHEIIRIGKDWDYSRTTGKYRNVVTGMNKKDFEKMLKNNFTFNESEGVYERKE